MFGVAVAATAPGAAHEHEQRILLPLYTAANTLPSGIVQVASRKVLDWLPTEGDDADGPTTSATPHKELC